MQAAELGRWGFARMVLEHGLRRHPKHAIMAEKLVEVLLQLGDWQAAASAVQRLLAQDPSHPRAMHLRSASVDPGMLRSFVWCSCSFAPSLGCTLCCFCKTVCLASFYGLKGTVRFMR